MSIRKRWLTGIGVALATAVFFLIALSQGASMVVSTHHRRRLYWLLCLVSGERCSYPFPHHDRRARTLHVPTVAASR